MAVVMDECYSWTFLTNRDPWTYKHFVMPMLMELFLRDWKLSLVVTFFWETLEAFVLTAFGSYLVFGASNLDFETASGALLGDVSANTIGILIAILIRTRIIDIPPLLVWPVQSVKWFFLTLLQLVVILSVWGLALILRLTFLPLPGNFYPDPAIIFVWLTQMGFFYFLYHLTLVNRPYREMVWHGTEGIHYVKSVYITLAVSFTFFAIPFFLALPASLLIVYGTAYLFTVLVTVRSMRVRERKYTLL